MAARAHRIYYVVNGHLAHSQAGPQSVNHAQIFIAGARGEFLGQADHFRQRMKLYARCQFIPLGLEYNEKVEIRAMVSEFKGQVESALQHPMMAEFVKGPLSFPKKTVPALLSFVGEKVFQGWNFREHEHWQQPRTSGPTIHWSKKLNPPTRHVCRGHTTPHCSLKNTNPRFEIVQCESCHGPSEGHSDPCEEPEGTDEDNCPQPHNPTNSPNFNDDIYVQKIFNLKVNVPNGKYGK